MSKTLLALDPGKLKHGWALFEDGALVACGKLEPAKFGGATYDEIVVELPQVYGLRGGKGNDPNDLVDITFEAGRTVGLVGARKVTTTRPTNWKAQVPKEIVHNRCRRVMSIAEQGLAEGRGRGCDHNVWDAIALGLWHLGRIERGGG